ncbi:MAG: hypothetical protein WBP58_04300 [Chitinophagaceae bacterium]
MEQQIFFHHFQQLSKAELEQAVKLYRTGLHENETTSCFLTLDNVKKLVDDTEKLHGKGKVEGFRVYFYRADPRKKYKDPNAKILDVDGKPQMSIIMVPITDYKVDGPRSAIDMFDKDGKVLVLTPGGEHTGLCPTNCGGSI